MTRTDKRQVKGLVAHLTACAGLATVLLAASSGATARDDAPAAGDGTEVADAQTMDTEELVSPDFRMPVMDAFKITGTGTVVTGKIETGYVRKGATLCLEGVEGQHELKAIEQFRKVVERTTAGEHVGLLFTGLPDGLAPTSTVVRPCG